MKFNGKIEWNDGLHGAQVAGEAFVARGFFTRLIAILMMIAVRHDFRMISIDVHFHLLPM